MNAPVFGWGCEGHQAIALIARAHLTSAASSAVDRLLRENPIDPSLNRFCKDVPADLMADSATWADDAKNIEKTGEWHYIDIPLSVSSEQGDVNAWCAPIGRVEPGPAEPGPTKSGKDRSGCITDAIAYELNILGDKTRTGADRAKALRYIIHFVGDIHQPLHDEDNNDRGGNCTALSFFAEGRPANLHAVWDYKLIEHELAQTRETTAQFAAALDSQFGQQWNEWGQVTADPVAWAWESHALARSVVYRDLMPQIRIEQPGAQADCELVRERVAAAHLAVGNSYYEQVRPVIGEQLAKAGYRLAAVLNDVLGRQ